MAKTIKDIAALKYPFMEENDTDHIEALKYIGIEIDGPNAFNEAQSVKQLYFIAGANYVLREMESEIMRSFLEDYNDFTDSDREIAQGVLGRLNIWIKQQKGK